MGLGRWPILRAGVGLVGLGVGLVAGTSAVRVARLRRSAAVHGHELDHAAVVGEGPGDPVRLVVLGDSAARGFGLEDPADAFPQQVARRVAAATGRPVDVQSMATDGHRTRDVADVQVPLLRAAHPDALVVSVGVNDAVRGTARTDLLAATHDLLTGVRAAADGAALVFVTCPDLARAPGLPWPVGSGLGWRCRRVAALQAEVAADLGVAVVPLPRAGRELFGADGFHPGQAGQAAMAEATVDALLARAARIGR